MTRRPRGLTISLALILTAGLLEVVLRIAGYLPPQTPPDTALGSADSAAFAVISKGGITLQPGRHTVSLSDGDESVITHDEFGRRVSEPLDQFLEATPENEIWIFGGAAGYGWMLDDTQVSAWVVRTALADAAVLNFSAPGQSTGAFVNGVDEAMATGGPPKMVVVVVDTDVWDGRAPSDYFSADDDRPLIRSAVLRGIGAPIRWLRHRSMHQEIQKDLLQLSHSLAQQEIELLILTARDPDMSGLSVSVIPNSLSRQESQNWVATQIIEHYRANVDS